MESDGTVELNKEEQALKFAEIYVDIFSFLPFVKIQEPGDLKVNYELWGHLVDFYNQL